MTDVTELVTESSVAPWSTALAVGAEGHAPSADPTAAYLASL